MSRLHLLFSAACMQADLKKDQGVCLSPSRQLRPTKPCALSRFRHNPKQALQGQPIVTVPFKMIANAIGLCIFTARKSNDPSLEVYGSGIIIARLLDGSWGPPSGILINSIGDALPSDGTIFDCCIIINTREELEMFARRRVTIGTDIALTPGPWGFADSPETQTGAFQRFKLYQGGEGSESATSTLTSSVLTNAYKTSNSREPDTNGSLSPLGTARTTTERKRVSVVNQTYSPVISYVQSGGVYVGVQVDGTSFTENQDANHTLYGQSLTPSHIINGLVPDLTWREKFRMLLEALDNMW